MIYFSDEIKKQLVRSFYNALQPGGYFYIGHSETLHGISKAFKLVYFKNALVYHKEAAGTTPAGDNGSINTVKRVSTASKPDTGGATRALDLLSKIKSSNETAAKK
jgi:hypothetical protein